MSDCSFTIQYLYRIVVGEETMSRRRFFVLLELISVGTVVATVGAVVQGASPAQAQVIVLVGSLSLVALVSRYGPYGSGNKNIRR